MKKFITFALWWNVFSAVLNAAVVTAQLAHGESAWFNGAMCVSSVFFAGVVALCRRAIS